MISVLCKGCFTQCPVRRGALDRCESKINVSLSGSVNKEKAMTDTHETNPFSRREIEILKKSAAVISIIMHLLAVVRRIWCWWRGDETTKWELSISIKSLSQRPVADAAVILRSVAPPNTETDCGGIGGGMHNF